jgi:hypothetical protein
MVVIIIFFFSLKIDITIELNFWAVAQNFITHRHITLLLVNLKQSLTVELTFLWVHARIKLHH